MKPETWKKIAIIFIVLFILETLFFLWGYILVTTEERKANECFYDFCGDYYDAEYDEGVCICYELDLMGEYVVADTTYMG